MCVRNTLYCYLFHIGLIPVLHNIYYLVRPGYHVKYVSYHCLIQHIHVLEAQLETDCL